MTEAEWLAATKPEPMLAFLRSKVSDRKLRLFACGCCRRMWDMLTTEADRSAIELGEQLADGEQIDGAVESLRRAIDWRSPGAAKYAIYPNATTAADAAQETVTRL